MRLYYSPASPYVRKVMVVLHETGQVQDVELVAASTDALGTGASPIGRNPIGKIPTLERADGPALYDSRVITRFLDARAGAGLYPEPPRLWDALTLEATGDGILDAALLVLYESRHRPEEKRFEQWTDGQWTKVMRACKALEALWLSHLRGRLDIGQIAVGCALSYLDFRHAGRNWRDGCPELAEWHADFSGRRSMQATAPQDA